MREKISPKEWLESFVRRVLEKQVLEWQVLEWQVLE